MVDDYFDGPAFEHIRSLLMDTVPEAGHGTSYGDGCAQSAGRRYRARQLTAFQPSTGTIRLTAATPLPDQVVRDIVRYQIEQIVGPTRQMPPRTAAHAGRWKSIHIGICGSPAYPG